MGNPVHVWIENEKFILTNRNFNSNYYNAAMLAPLIRGKTQCKFWQLAETKKKVGEQVMTFGERVTRFNDSLDFTGDLPADIEIMNPFRNNLCATTASRIFYRKYYADERKRGIILGINPGRFGAGITGVPFTDPVRLREKCDIDVPACEKAREPSSVFIYDMIAAYGGVSRFYSDWYINSICPLGFVRKNDRGKWINYNYYDLPALEKAAMPFILKTLPEQIRFGVYTQICFSLGTGKNAAFLNRLNKKHGFFDSIHALEHPRYIMQYKSGSRDDYIHKYVEELKNAIAAMRSQSGDG